MKYTPLSKLTADPIKVDVPGETVAIVLPKLIVIPL
jgi:hypothetical protein